ncbi:DUF6221 family protein [Streptomyces sp. NPDC056169]|uniref:DUF6221 family protein n=1 Tax=Streptomyces sp. NPDC056169 TaxID=3345734 RepID=UPI0035D57452
MDSELRAMLDFWAARLDETAALAEASARVDPTPWTASVTDDGGTAVRSGHGSGLLTAADEEPLWDCESSNSLCMTAPSARHVVAHAPGRVLRHVEAARRRMAALADAITAGHDSFDLAAELLPLEVAAWTGHPDYREEWRR